MSATQKTGLQNLLKNLTSKLEDLRGTPHSIAIGFSIGVAVSFTPFVGFHLLIALLVAHLSHQNSIAATIGTITGNPWTFPFIWYATWRTGEIILGKATSSQSIDYIHLLKSYFMP